MKKAILIIISFLAFGRGFSQTTVSSATNTQTINYLTKWTSVTGTPFKIGNSVVYDNGSYVGIGTVVPGSKLQVNGNATIGYSTSTPAPANGMIISGNVGIGHTTPDVKLSVLGIVRTNDADILFRTSGDVNHGLGWYGSTKAFGTQPVDGPVLYGYNSGILGITYPQKKEILKWDNDYVRINAKVKALEFTAQTDVWSDYVFADNYKLMPIAELETFLTTNKHLPEIPSEQEIIENGLNLGEMQNLQMKKIEELTLYIIELNKKNEELQKKVEALESLIY